MGDVRMIVVVMLVVRIYKRVVERSQYWLHSLTHTQSLK